MATFMERSQAGGPSSARSGDAGVGPSGLRRVADRSPRKPVGDHRCPAGERGRAAPFYVLHEPVVVAAVWAMVRWHAPILGEHVSLVIVPFGGTLAPYEVLVRRFGVTRFVSGMKPAPRLTDLEGNTR
jgi:hypothetical protein